MATVFLRLLAHDKPAALAKAVVGLRGGEPNRDVHIVDPESFRQVPGSPFAYWVSEKVRRLFTDLEMFERNGRESRCGMGTLDDFRFLRAWWEIRERFAGRSIAAVNHLARWFPYAKGGEYAQYYSSIFLVVNFQDNGKEVKAYVESKVGSASRKVQAECFYFRPGITWSRRSQIGLSFRVLPAGCIIADKGPALFANIVTLPVLLGLTNRRSLWLSRVYSDGFWVL